MSEIITKRLEEGRIEIRPFGSIEDEKINEEDPKCGIKCLAFVLPDTKAERLRQALNEWARERRKQQEKKRQD